MPPSPWPPGAGAPGPAGLSPTSVYTNDTLTEAISTLGAVHKLDVSLPAAELAALYAAADVGWVAPLRDGMNLVAKEYVAAQDPEDPGVLILSRFAGAALQLKDALMVNPYSPDEISDAIFTALAMPKEERIRRWRGMIESVRGEDVVAWRHAFVSALENAKPAVAAEPA